MDIIYIAFLATKIPNYREIEIEEKIHFSIRRREWSDISLLLNNLLHIVNSKLYFHVYNYNRKIEVAYLGDSYTFLEGIS